MNSSIHPTAIVDPGATIGDGTQVWHFCHIMPGARIGALCVLGQNVYVGGAAVIGDGCKIENNVSVFDGVELEADVFVGPSVVFTNVKTPRAFISRKSELKPTRVGRGATIGANATIVCGVSLGPFCLVAAGAVVTADVPAHALMAGVPARRRGWVCRCGATLSVSPAAGGDGSTCDACGSVVQLGAAASEGT
jgi:UDP-2-acetamido-3-amino-2,3-dideoxy-glucuronate N-acetyltransferase